MAAISGTLTTTTPSADFQPSESVSDVVISPNAGKVRLECKAPGMSNYVLISNEGGAFPEVTADPAILYRFVASGADIDIDYYMGP